MTALWQNFKAYAVDLNYTAEDVAEARRLHGGKIHEGDQCGRRGPPGRLNGMTAVRTNSLRVVVSSVLTFTLVAAFLGAGAAFVSRAWVLGAVCTAAGAVILTVRDIYRDA
jgi:hypothetical protein